jgi:hypothetical protein
MEKRYSLIKPNKKSFRYGSNGGQKFCKFIVRIPHLTAFYFAERTNAEKFVDGLFAKPRILKSEIWALYELYR